MQRTFLSIVALVAMMFMNTAAATQRYFKLEADSFVGQGGYEALYAYGGYGDFEVVAGLETAGWDKIDFGMGLAYLASFEADFGTLHPMAKVVEAGTDRRDFGFAFRPKGHDLDFLEIDVLARNSLGADGATWQLSLLAIESWETGWDGVKLEVRSFTDIVGNEGNLGGFAETNLWAGPRFQLDDNWSVWAAYRANLVIPFDGESRDAHYLDLQVAYSF